MNPEFEQTLNSPPRFKTYSLSLILLNKSVQTIQQRGADPEAVRMILHGIQMLNKQLSKAVDVLKRRQQVNRFIAGLQNEWNLEDDERKMGPGFGC